MKTLRPFGLLLGCVLLGANLIAFQVLVSDRPLRLDLTEDRMYTVSDASVQLVSSLRDKLVVRAFLSEDTHSLLEPLVPQLSALLEEYASLNPERVDLMIGDPLSDTVLVQAATAYGVKPQQFRHRTRSSAGFKQSYFTIALQMGDQVEQLGMGELIQVQPTANDGELQVDLKNPEYLLSQAIKSLEERINAANLLYQEVEARFDVYFSDPAPLRERGEDAAQLADRIVAWRAVVVETMEALKARTAGRIDYQLLPAPADERGQLALYQQTGLRPRGFTMLGEDGRLEQIAYYADGYLYANKRRVFVPCSGGADFNPTTLQEDLETLLKRLLPGFRRTVGVLFDPTGIPPQQLQQLQVSEGRYPFHGALVGLLQRDFEVSEVDLAAGVPETEVLCLARPENLSEIEVYHLDQYVMRGGRLLLLSDKFEWEMPRNDRQMSIKKIETGLDSLMVSWGVEHSPHILKDDRCWAPYLFFIEKNNTRNLMVDPYPYFPMLGGRGLNEEMPAVSQLESFVGMFVSPLEITPVDGIEATWMFRSSERSWTEAFTPLVHPFDVTIENGQYSHDYMVPGIEADYPTKEGHPLGERTLAVALQGTFPSSFDGRPGEPGPDDLPHLESSPDDQRVVVIADAEAFSDYAAFLLEGRPQPSLELNGAVLRNAIDWLTQDEALMQIRTRGVKRRHLDELDDRQKDLAQLLNFVIPFLIVAFAGILWNYGLRTLGAPKPE